MLMSESNTVSDNVSSTHEWEDNESDVFQLQEEVVEVHNTQQI
jgi:hypothetical protein